MQQTFAFQRVQHNNNNNMNNNMNNNPQQQQQQNGNGNASAIQQQINHAHQMQQMSQGQINQLNQMKQHFQQFQINQQQQIQQNNNNNNQQIQQNNQFQQFQANNPQQRAQMQQNQQNQPQNNQMQLNQQQNNQNNQIQQFQQNQPQQTQPSQPQSQPPQPQPQPPQPPQAQQPQPQNFVQQQQQQTQPQQNQIQYQSPQQSPQNNQFQQNQAQNQQMQMQMQQNNVNNNINNTNNNNFAQNQNQNQSQQQQNVVWNPQTNQFQTQAPTQQIIQLNGGDLQQQLQQQQQQQQQQLNGGDPNIMNGDNNNDDVNIEASILNPVAAEFNPNSFIGQPTLSIQEQLFNQLQAINTQMQNIKWKTENELTPALIQLNQQMLLFQANPALLQIPQNQMQYYTIQQNQIIISSNINQFQMTYKQLEQNLKYTQEMYRKNKDEQYVVPIDETIIPMTDGNNPNNPNITQLQPPPIDNNVNINVNGGGGATFNLTQDVTVISVTDRGWQPAVNENDTQIQQIQPNHDQNQIQNQIQNQEVINDQVQPDDEQLDDEQPDHEQNQHPVQEHLDENVMNEEEIDQASNEKEDPHTIKFMDVEEEDIQNIPENNDINHNNEPPQDEYEEEEEPPQQEYEEEEYEEEYEEEEYEEEELPPQEEYAQEEPPQETEEEEEEEEEPPQEEAPQEEEEEEKTEMNGQNGTSMPFSKFTTSARQNSFGHALISTPHNPESPPSSTSDGHEEEEEDDSSNVMVPLKQSKSDIPFHAHYNNNTLKPKPIMEKAFSCSSQQSNGSSNRFDIPEDDEVDYEEEKNINPNETRYNVSDLIALQKKFVQINWSEQKNKEIPLRLRFINLGINNEKYMQDVVAMFRRRAVHRWEAGKGPTSKKDELLKKLTGVLNKMTPEKFAKIAKQTMDIVNEYAATKAQMQIIIGLVLGFGIKQPVFGDQYALLCSHLQEYLPKLRMISDNDWVVNDDDVSQTFRKMVIQQTNELFTRHRAHTPTEEEVKQWKADGDDFETLELKKEKRKRAFFAVMVLVAELFNVELIKKNLVFKGVFEEVLKGPKEVDLEGLCRLFKRCGKKLDEEAKKYVDKYLQKLVSHARKFDFRTRVLVDEIKEMRENNWETRLKKEKAKTQQEIKEDFDKEQAQKESGRRHHSNDYYNDRRGGGRGRGSKGKKKGGRRDDYYEDNSYQYGDDYDDSQKGYHGYSTGNLKRMDRYGRRDRRSQSSMNLRTGMKDRSYDNHSWGNDDSSIGTANGKYRQKYSTDKPGMSPSKSYGTVYQKKEKQRDRSHGMNRNKSDGSQYSNDSIVSNGDGGGNSYGDKETIRSLKSYIDEYMASGVMDEILELNCNDIKVWASVINDGLRDRQSRAIPDFIELILRLFDEKVLHNKSGSFVNTVIKYLVIQLDDNCVDCPNFIKYVAELFSNLCYHRHLNPDPCYNYFIKKYKEYSECPWNQQRKTINKVIKYSTQELNRLQASFALIDNVQRKAV